ncbi:MAG: arabinan endo-1,5-alpha-L-arabinosidase [Polyangiales bacterium]
MQRSDFSTYPRLICAWLSVSWVLVACMPGPARRTEAAAAASPDAAAPVDAASPADAAVPAADGGQHDAASGAEDASGAGGEPSPAASGGAAAIPGSGGMLAAGGGGSSGSLESAGQAAADGVSGGPALGSDLPCDAAPAPDAAEAPGPLTLSGEVAVHDPVAITHADEIYVFHTGPGITIKRSRDLLTWRDGGRVFTRTPDWIAEHIAAADDLWAPDIALFNGLYHLYYAASTAGSNHSCIGHATSADPSQPFTDQGDPVICSNDDAQRKDDWNAIDPHFIADDQGKPHLVFGSFWGGIKLTALDATAAHAEGELITLAARPQAGGAIEAPYIVRRCGVYYLFASIDRCCDGANSTYKTLVGRANALIGPYTDQRGIPLLDGGGTVLVQGDATWSGPGHNAVLLHGDKTYNIYHAYYAGTPQANLRKDASYLRITELHWNADGWPLSTGP